MSTQTSSGLDGLEPPEPGAWEMDRAHTTVEFVGRHLLTRVRGRFTEFDGTIEAGERPEDSRVEIRIAAASIESGSPDRDAHLKSPDFLDVERYPELVFRGKELHPTGGNRFELVGDLTVKDVTREVVLDAEYLGVVSDPWGGRRASFTASTEIDREDWDMTWNVVIEAGNVLVGKKVQLEIEIELMRAPEVS